MGRCENRRDTSYAGGHVAPGTEREIPFMRGEKLSKSVFIGFDVYASMPCMYLLFSLFHY